MAANSEAGPILAAGRDTPGVKGKAALAMAGILAALGASSCCVIPFALFTFGVSGAWIGTLTGLAPYQPIFLTLAFASLATGFVLVYRRPKAACVEGSSCARPRSGWTVKAGLWAGTFLVVLALAFPYLAPLLDDL